MEDTMQMKVRYTSRADRSLALWILISTLFWGALIWKLLA
jgi:hypothetical protein